MIERVARDNGLPPEVRSQVTAKTDGVPFFAEELTTGTGLGQPYYLALLSQAYGTVGRPEPGVHMRAEALARVEKTGERW